MCDQWYHIWCFLLDAKTVIVRDRTKRPQRRIERLLHSLDFLDSELETFQDEHALSRVNIVVRITASFVLDELARSGGCQQRVQYFLFTVTDMVGIALLVFCFLAGGVGSSDGKEMGETERDISFDILSLRYDGVLDVGVRSGEVKLRALTALARGSGFGKREGIFVPHAFSDTIEGIVPITRFETECDRPGVYPELVTLFSPRGGFSPRHCIPHSSAKPRPLDGKPLHRALSSQMLCGPQTHQSATTSEFMYASYSKPQYPTIAVNTTSEHLLDHLPTKHRLRHNTFNMLRPNSPIPNPLPSQRIVGEARWYVDDNVSSPLVPTNVRYQSDSGLGRKTSPHLLSSFLSVRPSFRCVVQHLNVLPRKLILKLILEYRTKGAASDVPPTMSADQDEYLIDLSHA